MADHSQPEKGIEARVRNLEIEQLRMSFVQERTNEILTEFRGDAKKAIGWLAALFATAFATALFGLILKK